MQNKDIDKQKNSIHSSTKSTTRNNHGNNWERHKMTPGRSSVRKKEQRHQKVPLTTTQGIWNPNRLRFWTAKHSNWHKAGNATRERGSNCNYITVNDSVGPGEVVQVCNPNEARESGTWAFKMAQWVRGPVATSDSELGCGNPCGRRDELTPTRCLLTYTWTHTHK